MPWCHRQPLDCRALAEDLKLRMCKETSSKESRLGYLKFHPLPVPCDSEILFLEDCTVEHVEIC